MSLFILLHYHGPALFMPTTFAPPVSPHDDSRDGKIGSHRADDQSQQLSIVTENSTRMHRLKQPTNALSKRPLRVGSPTNDPARIP